MEKVTNQLYPIFLKLEKLQLLIVGGGYVCNEKLSSILKNSPSANIKIVAKDFSKEVLDKVKGKKNIELIKAAFNEKHLLNIDIAIVAIDDKKISKEIHAVCKKYKIICNVADKPELCDFYMGSIVSKGNVKIAISTNGKSPTLAKRLKEFLNTAIPDEIDELSENLAKYRATLKTSFNEKIKALNEATKSLIN